MRDRGVELLLPTYTPIALFAIRVTSTLHDGGYQHFPDEDDPARTHRFVEMAPMTSYVGS